MSVQALLAEVDPSWYGEIDPALLAQARDSRLGRRMLARWLAVGPAATLLAPAPGEGAAAAATGWPPARLAALVRDLGALAYAPAIRAEVRREPVRRLKQALGNGYLLALDNTVWNGRVDPVVGKRLAVALASALADAGDDALFAALDWQGRAELDEWAGKAEPALGEWARLLGCRDDALEAAHLPEKPILRVYAHHQARAVAH